MELYIFLLGFALFVGLVTRYAVLKLIWVNDLTHSYLDMVKRGLGHVLDNAEEGRDLVIVKANEKLTDKYFHKTMVVMRGNNSEIDNCEFNDSNIMVFACRKIQISRVNIFRYNPLKGEGAAITLCGVNGFMIRNSYINTGHI
jgi:hypothetical protein